MLTPKEFAKSRQVSVDTVVRHCQSGRLPCENYATGKRRAKWRISADAKLAPEKQERPPYVDALGTVDLRERTRRIRRRSATVAVRSYLPSV